MKKLWQLCACAAGVLAGLWLTARILLPVGLPFLLWPRPCPAGPAACRAPAPPAARAGCIPQRDGRVPRRGRRAHGPRVGVVAGLRCPVRPSAWPALLAGRAAAAPACRGPAIWPARLPDGMGEAAAQWVDRLFAGGSVVADSVSQGVFGCVTRVLGWMPQLLLFGLTALLSAYFLAGDAPRLRALAARHVPEEWRARGGSSLCVCALPCGAMSSHRESSCSVTFGVVSLGLLAALRRPHAVLLGALIAVVDALPVLGSGTVLLPWAAVSLLRGSGGLALGLTVTYAAAAFARSALEPRLLGRQIGLPPLLTLLSLYAGYRLFGLAGMILLPLAVLLAKQVWELAEGNGGGIDGAL